MKPLYDPTNRPIEPPDIELSLQDFADLDLQVESSSNGEEPSTNDHSEEHVDSNVPVSDEPRITRQEDCLTIDSTQGRRLDFKEKSHVVIPWLSYEHVILLCTL